jgi:two-component system sensor histidine kinase/response regulator
MIDVSLKTANILIVDDQEANIDVLEGLLEMQGYINIKKTADPREVIELYKTFKPDIILLDLSMPYMSGFDVMEKLSPLIPENIFLPILVLTADVSSESKQRALSGGASDFLTKPFDLFEVGLRIQNLLFSSYLQQQLLKHNQILEEKVQERTYELQLKNIELLAAKEKAEASDRLKSSFINNISHEIRTPLNGILGFGQILAEEDLAESEKEMYLQMLNSSSLRLIDTVTNFLDIAMLTSGNQKVSKKEFNPGEVLQNVVQKYKDKCHEKSVSITLQKPSDHLAIKIFTDVELFGKIIHQLVDNAVKFTSQGSILTGFEMIGDEINFFVKDTGIGISEENKMHIFENFRQEDSNTTRGYEGSGLGLPIASKFIQLLDGKIWLESEKGKGSTFHFSLPTMGKATTINLQNIVHKHITGTKQTILIAEDDIINFYYFKALLLNELIEIIHAKNGIEAVQICQNHPEIELVLMDLKMPEMDGFEATRQIKLIRKDLPIIAITAYCESEDKRMALEAGCNEFITKPVKKEFFIKKLEEFGVSRYLKDINTNL